MSIFEGPSSAMTAASDRFSLTRPLTALNARRIPSERLAVSDSSQWQAFGEVTISFQEGKYIEGPPY